MNSLKPLHIFKAGPQTDMSGRTIQFGESDLAASARAYDRHKHEAPIVIGHPKHDNPAYGWIKSLAVGQDGLLAEPDQIDAAFADMVTAGRFKKISASFYLPDSPSNPVPGVYYLRHVGFLGAQPPAVKGLKQAEFGEGEQGIVEFGDWDDRTNASLWRGLRDWLLGAPWGYPHNAAEYTEGQSQRGRFGQEEADRALPGWNVDSLQVPLGGTPTMPPNSLDASGSGESAAQPDGPAPAFTEPTTIPVSPPPSTTEENPVTPEEKARLEAENAQLKQQLAAAEAEKKTAAATKRHGEHLAYAEQLVSEGKLAPKHRDTVVTCLDFADGEQPLEFGEGATRQPLANAIKSFLGDMPKVVEFGEAATKDKAGKGGDLSAAGFAEFAEKSTDPDRLNLHVRATELAATKGISYEQAARQLIAH